MMIYEIILGALSYHIQKVDTRKKITLFLFIMQKFWSLSFFFFLCVCVLVCVHPLSYSPFLIKFFSFFTHFIHCFFYIFLYHLRHHVHTIQMLQKKSFFFNASSANSASLARLFYDNMILNHIHIILILE